MKQTKKKETQDKKAREDQVLIDLLQDTKYTLGEVRTSVTPLCYYRHIVLFLVLQV